MQTRLTPENYDVFFKMFGNLHDGFLVDFTINSRNSDKSGAEICFTVISCAYEKEGIPCYKIEFLLTNPNIVRMNIDLVEEYAYYIIYHMAIFWRENRVYIDFCENFDSSVEECLISPRAIVGKELWYSMENLGFDIEYTW